jgi:NAD(P)-dependent dehydrogenase (short-subunit alcohol dehydrogenase family)
MRSQRSGHIIQVSSVGGICSFPNTGAYHASKWALEGISESMAHEVAPLGIKVTIVEPTAFRTDWSGASARTAAAMPEYDYVRESAAKRRAGQTPGDAKAAAAALLELVDADDPPLRVLFGAQAPTTVYNTYEARLKTWKDWEDLSRRAQA